MRQQIRNEMAETVRRQARRLINELRKRSLIPDQIREGGVEWDADSCCFVIVGEFEVGNNRLNISIWYDDILNDNQPAFWVGFGAYNDPTLETLVKSCEFVFPDPQWITKYQILQTQFENVVGKPTVDQYHGYRGFGIYGRRGKNTVDSKAAVDFIQQVLRCLPEYRVKPDNPWETSIWVMANHAEQAARNANGQTVVRLVKVKPKKLGMTRPLLENYIEQLLEAQQYKCALTGINLQPLGADTDQNFLPSLDRIDSKKFLPSLDRIDSNGDYKKRNLQVVCQFINFWKCGTPNDTFKKFLALVRRPIASN